MKDFKDTVCFSSRGQVVIPRKYRKELGIEEGTRAVIESEKGAIVLTPITREYVKTHYGRLRGRNLLKALAEEKERERNK